MNKMPDTKIIEPVDENIEEEEKLPDIKNLPKESPFVRQEKQEIQEKINYNMLNKKKLCEMCKLKGYRGYSKLTKPNLIKLISGESLEDVLTQKPKPKKVNKTIDIDPQDEIVKAKIQKTQPNLPTKPKELVKEEPLIKELPKIETHIPEEKEVIEPQVQRPKPQPPPTPKPKPQPRPQAPPEIKQPHKVIPPKQEKLYNPFKQTYRIM